MPNKIMQWNELTSFGNPTRSQAVNEMIKLVRKFEVRGQGAESKARRPLREAEFRAMIAQMRQAHDIETKYLLPALMTFQFHMIGRIDDCCKWRRENLAIHEVHDKAAKARLAWSKNVTDERAAPWQHVFGCMDFVFCVLLNVGLFLEVFHDRHHNARVRPMVFGLSEITDDAERAGDDGKAKVYSLLRPFFNAIGVDHTEENNKLGSHSTRKYASTWTRSNGISKDDKDHRGRWKSKRISDGYDDVQLDWIDAKVAQVLCPGGVCAYEVVDPGCTNEWISAHVMPHIAVVFGNGLAILFGKAILWLAFSAHYDLMPQDMRNRIVTAYESVRTTEGAAQPVKKRLVTVTGHEAQVFMEVVGHEEHVNNNGDNGPIPVTPENPNGRSAPSRQVLLSLMAQTNSLRWAIAEQNNTLELL